MTEKRIDVVVRTGNSKQAVDSLDKSMVGLGVSADRATDSNKKLTSEIFKLNPVAKSVIESVRGFGTNAERASTGIEGLGAASNKAKAELAAIDQEFINLVRDSELAERAVKRFENTQRAMGNTVNKNGVIFDKNGNVLKNLTADYMRLNKAVTTANQKLEVTGKKANVALSGLGRNAGMAGIQVQQFVGQIQGGQSAMLALSQQGADLGFVLGAPLAGAVIGITASAVGMAMAFMETGDSTEELIEKIKDLKNETNLTAEQKAFLAAETEKENRAKRALIKEIKEEIASTERRIAQGQDVIDSGRIMTQGDLNRAKAVRGLREELLKLQAQQSTLEQELSPVKDTKEVDAINEQINREREIYEAARFQRLRTEAGFQTKEIEQINIATANRTLALQTRFEQDFEKLRENGQATEELERLHQDQLAQIVQEGEDRKAAIQDRANLMTQNKLQQAAKLTEQSYKQSGQLVLSTLMQLAGGSEKAAKAIKIAQGGMAAYMVYSNYQAASAAMLAPPPLGLGPIEGQIPAALLSKAGKVQAALTLAGATASAFSGSSVSAPSVSQPTESLIGTGAQAQQPQQVQSQRFVDIRLDDNALLTGSSVKEIINNLLSTDEDVTMNITAQQNNLRRTGAI